MSSRRAHVLVAIGALVLAACSGEIVVTAEHADQLAATPADPPANPDDPPATESGETEAPPTEAPSAPPPTEAPSAPPPTEAPSAPPPTAAPDPAAIDFGPDKPPRDHDDFLAATATDLAQWWSEQYPAIYGVAFEPLSGSIIAAYPARPGKLPGCGTARTTYEEVAEYVAFYCGDGDFIIYDDGPNSLLAQLAGEYGPSTIAIVLAHEYGHAIQLRNGALGRALSTVTTEQQADCFAGAWAARTARGESAWVAFTDDDVRSGLIAMLEVRDPVGFDQRDPGGHGSGFDRVNAFQVGFNEGPARCADLLDAPLSLTPNVFVDPDDRQSGGNAPLNFSEDGLLTFLPEDLNLFWDEELDAEVPAFTPLTVEVNETRDDVTCADLVDGFDHGGALCPSTATVHLNGPIVQELHQNSLTLGDFSVGYLLATAWSEAVQGALGSDLEGEPRHLRNDCLTGAWVQTVIPIAPFTLPEPRHPDRGATVSPGDLDEAIRTQIRIGDAGADDNVIGTPFEKINSFRAGVLGGLEACGL